MITLSGLNPSSGERLIAANSNIQLSITSTDSDILLNTLNISVSGSRAIVAGQIYSEFSDPASTITPIVDGYAININPKNNLTLNTQYVIQVTAKDASGYKLSTSYNFYTIENAPILVEAVPKDGSTLKVPQTLSLRFDDILDDIASASINITINGLNYIEAGIINLEYNGGFSEIDIAGSTCNILLDPQPPLKNGSYKVEYSISDVLDNTRVGSVKFIVDKDEEVLPTLFPQIQFLGFFQGIQKAQDDGVGDQITVSWNKPLKRSYQNDSFLLIYEEENRLKTFDKPKYLVPDNFTELSIADLTTGKTLSYGVRALEFPINTFTPNGMVQAHDNGYLIPNPIELSAPISSSATSFTTTSSAGYPDYGFLLLDFELVRYSSIDRPTNTFTIAERGLLGTTPASHDKPVNLFLGCIDSNTVIIMSTPTYHDDESSGREINNIGLVVTDYTDNDQNKFQRFDYCGWRYNRPQDILYGKKDCGSYLGGEYNGFRGFNVYDRMLAQEEMLIEATGEPVILLKRIWDGLTCSCMNNRKVSPKIRSCPSCYGTGYEGGYIKYDYPRRADGRILVSFKEAAEDLKHGEKEHLQQEFEPAAWTLAQPTIKDRDLLVRFDFTNDIEFIYEVLGVSRSKNFKRRFGRQDLTLKRMDKTDIIYTYALELDNPDINNPS